MPAIPRYQAPDYATNDGTSPRAVSSLGARRRHDFAACSIISRRFATTPDDAASFQHNAAAHHRGIPVRLRQSDTFCLIMPHVISLLLIIFFDFIIS